LKALKEEVGTVYGPEEILRAKEAIARRISLEPPIAVVLGSGLGALANGLDEAVAIPYDELPFWPHSTAPGHAGRLVVGRLSGIPLLAMQGRVHLYEGYSARDVVFPLRVLAALGVRTYVATNASGGVNLAYRPGDLVLVEDHINLMGDNPLVGTNEETWGVRFPDMTEAYSPRLIKAAEKAAASEGIWLKRGVYVGFKGPSFETPAEIRMARILGGDLVGMSTIPEVIAANHLGLEVIAISCVANFAAGMTKNRLTHEEVLEEMGKASDRLIRLVRAFLREIAETHV
jgi:purine-nucleoside phosphorylase